METAIYRYHGNAPGASRHYPHSIPLADPLGPDGRKELKWYLEDYLSFPFGAEEYRAAQAETAMEKWGESLFEQVFAKGEKDPDPRGFYQEAVREGLEKCDLCITSDDEAFLNIPWELIRDPAPGRGFLATSLGALYRQRSGHRIEAPVKAMAGGPFRILLVIARPYGERDIPLGTVARPLLEAVRPLRPRLDLEVLRPPTFDALIQRLTARRGHYHLVHFDGHGVFAHPSGAAPTRRLSHFGALTPTGHLVFEKEDGSEDVISSRELGQALASSHVPLFVLNACQSAEGGREDPFSSVASQLVAVGAKGVVAMSYSVYAATASLFMQQFYERLIGHAPLAEAVAAGRRKLYASPDRQSVVGAIKLRDWVVPALYQQEQGYVPIPEGGGAGTAADSGEARQMGQPPAGESCPEGRFGFIGRDYDIVRIERALRDAGNACVLLTGMGGIGKTALAYGFAHWFAETGGCPGGVFAASFKEKAGFAQVVGSIAGYGADFSRFTDEQQWRFLVAYLRDNPCLLVWDNFETVAGYPQGAEPLAPPEERARLSGFLQALRGGRSRVLITTRKRDEGWLGVGYELVEMRGLTERDAGEFARAVLKGVGRRPEEYRMDPDYSRLLKLLKGHPRSLEVVLPHLRTTTPGQIIEALQHRVDSLGEAMEDASLEYAFSLMSPLVRRHLPFIGLFATYVDADTLGAFAGSIERFREAYVDIIGEALDAQGWESVLGEAARGGLVRPLGNRIYEVHPTLPSFLRRQLVSTAGQEGLARLDDELLTCYAVWAGAYFERVQRAEPNVLAAVEVEEANLLRALRLAEAAERWRQILGMVQTLGEFYEVGGRLGEWSALRGHVLGRVGREVPAGAERVRAALWMYLLDNEATEALRRNELAPAEDAYKRILAYLVSLNNPAVDPLIATSYHHFGIVALERQQYDMAEQSYRKAMEIQERLGLEQDAAVAYHQLGRVAQERQQYDLAEEWWRKALEIFERLGLERYAANDYHQLGMVAEERERYDLAEEHYWKALGIRERLGLERDAATDYHQLGIVAQHRHQYDLAEQWYRKALEISERLGLERDAAADYHHLGTVAEDRQQYDLAEQWYTKAMEVHERLGHPPDQVNTLAQLGVLRMRQERHDEAVSWLGRALAIAAQHNMSVTGRVLTVLARLIKEMGEEKFQQAWQRAFEGQEPPLAALREILAKLEGSLDPG